MIENAALENILLTATDISIVCEIYDADAVPGTDGFDPEDAIDCFAAIAGITFRTREYKRLVKKFGRIKRTIGEEVNSASVDFLNLDNEISQFEFTNGFEGLILVIRLISRSQSVALTDSQILFTGRCEKPKSGNRQTLSVTAKFILDAMTVPVPRRKFSKDDAEGRVASDPEYEGFLFIPRYGTSTYSVRQKRGGIAGLFGFKKTVTKTLQWSSYSDLDANKDVPEVFGRAQVLGVNIAYADIGVDLKIRTAFCEGEIEDMQNVRSVDETLPLTFIAPFMGLVGTANGPDDPTFPDYPSYYSRTAHTRAVVTNSSMDAVDPAPEVAAVIFGRLMLTPDGGGDWVATQWTDNGAAHTRFLITSEYYCKLDENWIDDATFLNVFNFNAEQIFNTSLSDFIFVEPA